VTECVTRANKLTIGLSLSLSGPHADMGSQAESALRLFVADTNAAGGIEINGQHHLLELQCADDKGDQRRAASIYQELCSSHRADLLFGPYGSGLVRVTAPIADGAGLLYVNHGGADDRIYQSGYRLLVGVLTPASKYMTELIRLVSILKFWRKRVAFVAADSPFASAVAQGADAACAQRSIRRRGTTIRIKYRGRFDPQGNEDRFYRLLRRNRINVLLSAGSYEHDVRVMRFASMERLSIPVLGCVAAGVNRFSRDLGSQAEGVIGPAQWDPSLEVQPLLGPTPAEFVARFRAMNGYEPDYPAAQAYAAGLLTVAALRAADSLESARIRAAFSHLRTSTLFGEFAIEPATGAQIAHQMLVVQWHQGRKVIIQPEPNCVMGELEFPPGWRLLLGSLHSVLMRWRDSASESARANRRVGG
jgi:branched-chain amino acid transport system substrate-binding protein